MQARMSRGGSFRSAAMRRPIEWKVAGDGRSPAHDRINPHPSSMQFDEGFYHRQAEPGAAMPRSVGMTLEPVEHLVLDLRWNAGSAVGHGKHHIMLGAFGAQHDDGILRRKSDGISKQII